MKTEFQMHIDEYTRQAINDRLPELIESEGLFRSDKERARFSLTSGGKFRCPICGAKLALYKPRSNHSNNPWNINGFGKCPHFGRGGQYHGSTSGLYAAIHGISENEAFMQLVRDEGIVPEYEGRRVRERKKADAIESEMSEARRRDNAAHCLISASWGDAMDDVGRGLMESRGIAMSRLPQDVRSLVGYVDDDSFLSQQGGRYHLSGIVFSLGGEQDLSVQIRCTRGRRFISKDDSFTRFMSFGEARPFNASVLSSSEAIFITEGPFDALSMIQCGADAVASIGAGNHGYIQECIFRNPNHPVVYIAYDDDDAGANGAESLKSALEMIPGLSVFRYPAAGTSHDFNDLLMADAGHASERIALGKGLAICLKRGSIDSGTVEKELEMIRTHDEAGDGTDFVHRSLMRLRDLYRAS